MVKFAYRKNGEVIEKEFKSNAELILFVATNNIDDNDFVSIDMPGLKAEGIDGLRQEAITRAENDIRAQKIAEIKDRLFEINNDYVCDDIDLADYTDEIIELVDELREYGINVEEDEDFEFSEVLQEVLGPDFWTGCEE